MAVRGPPFTSLVLVALLCFVCTSLFFTINTGLRGSPPPPTSLRSTHLDALTSAVDKLVAAAASVKAGGGGGGRQLGGMRELADKVDALDGKLEGLVAALDGGRQEQAYGEAPAAPVAVAAASGVQRNAVLGMATGIPLQNLYQFVRSLRTAAPSVVIVLFTDSKFSSEHQEVCRAFGVEQVNVDDARLPAYAAGYHPSSTRWLLMQKYLEALPTPYDNVMLTDVRDTVFQLDPFPFMKEPGFYAFLEAKPGTIRRCGWNSNWVKDCFGGGVLSQIGGNIISCSGTSMGSWQHVLQYVGLMAKELQGPQGTGNTCERNGVDQGMHNVFVWRKQVDDLHIITNEDGWIATCQSMSSIQRNMFGQVLNSKGDVVAVVHQWDRSPQLTQQYQQEFTIVDPRVRNKK